MSVRLSMIWCWLVLTVASYAQTSGDTLLLQDFYRLIGEHHPVAHQALLITQRGELAVSEARGAFDPS